MWPPSNQGTLIGPKWRESTVLIFGSGHEHAMYHFVNGSPCSFNFEGLVSWCSMWDATGYSSNQGALCDPRLKMSTVLIFLNSEGVREFIYVGCCTIPHRTPWDQPLQIEGAMDICDPLCGCS